MPSRGALIVVEGIDRSGKSTQCQKLVDALRTSGHQVKSMKFPDRTTETGKTINSYLQCNKDLDDRVIHLLFSRNRWEQSDEMLKNLNSGITLIVDRYAYSGVAYTGAKKGFTLDWCKQSDKGLPNPDVVFFLNLSSTEAEKRGGYGEERYEKVELQKRVRGNFLKLKSKEWKMIDAHQSLEKVHNEMLDISKNIIREIADAPIGKLWMDSSDAN